MESEDREELNGGCVPDYSTIFVPEKPIDRTINSDNF